MIPVIINNRDIHPRNIVRHCQRMDGAEVWLIDNASTFPQTIRYRDSPPSPLNVVRWQNTGPRAACKLVNRMREEWTRQGVEFYATTDSDLDLTGVPSDALKFFAGILGANRNFVKVGCALRLDDLPDTPQGRLARKSEAKHNHHSWPLHNGIAYNADIDTTFAVYRLNPPWDGSYGPSARIAEWHWPNRCDYTARHVPWYHTDENRPPDYQWYLDHCDPTGTFYTAMEKAR